MIPKFADSRSVGSLASRMRRDRVALLRKFLADVPPPISILDVGGTQTFWENTGLMETRADLAITILNVIPVPTSHPRISSVIGDARSMNQFEDKQFDIVFSNSVIEHLATLGDMHKMAEEIRRVGNRYFVQTPNRGFPLEPHFLFPFFQFLPFELKLYLVRHFSLGWYSRITDRTQAESEIRAIRLLSRKEISQLFPSASIREERLFGLVKSFIAYEPASLI